MVLWVDGAVGGGWVVVCGAAGRAAGGALTRRWLRSEAMATPSGVSASCTASKSHLNSREPSVSAPASSEKWTGGEGQSVRACSSSCSTR